MNAATAATDRAARLLPWVCFGLLVLPFHPLWIDFEQVRRGLLLMLTGAALLLAPRLRPVRGERVALVFVGTLLLSTVVHVTAQALFHTDGTPTSFQPWEAAYRIAHWLALWLVVRLGASQPARYLALPAASLLAITSLFGILQRLGLAEIAGYGVEREPVTTLGNLNVASEWTAIAAVAVAVLRPKLRRPRWLPIAALVLAGCYLVVNHSRSGMVATPIALALLWLLRRRQREAVPLLCVVAGAALGLLVDLAGSRPEPTPAALQQELERSTVTLDVRLEIAGSATRLFAESPVFGKGPGQFAVEYPRHRSQQEIEASSFGRQFATEVRTVHDDWLELLLDGGLLALGAFAWLLFALQRGMRDKARLLPLFALLLLMLIRAPIGNAPAAAIAFWLVGRPAPRRHAAAPRWLRLAATILIGLTLVVLGALPVAGNTAVAPYQRARRDGTPPPLAALRSARTWMPYEPRWPQLEAQELTEAALRERDRTERLRLAGRIDELTAHAISLRPFSPPLIQLRARYLLARSDFGAVLQRVQEGLALDPVNPELRALRSTALAELGDVDRAIEAVVVDPHPQLRGQLEHHFADLALRANERNEPKQARRYLIEFNYVGLIARLGPVAVEQKRQRVLMYDDLDTLVREAGRQQQDVRPEVAAALMALEIGKRDHANRFAKVVAMGTARLTTWQAALLGPHLERLRELTAWAPLLPPAAR